jgi:hypothetical protein
MLDKDTKRIVGVKPYAEFVPMFRQTTFIEKNWQFSLEEEETARECDSAERSYVQYGSDGIQKRMRRNNRYRARPFCFLF